MSHIFSPAQAQGAALWDSLSPNKEKKKLPAQVPFGPKPFFLESFSPVLLSTWSFFHFLLLEKFSQDHSGPAAGSTGRIQTVN